MLAPTTGTTANLILKRDASRVHPAKPGEFSLNSRYFFFQSLELCFSFHSDMVDNLADIVNIEFSPSSLEPWRVGLRADLAEAIQRKSGMGSMEVLIETAIRKEAAKELERALQQVADEAEFCCPRCRMSLNVIAHGKQRTVSSVFGPLTFSRSYGFCPRCETSCFPADDQLGLAPHAKASPRVQEVCASMVLSAPAAVAAESDACLMGLGLSASTMHREAVRQGQRAMDLRDADAHLTRTPEGIRELSSRATPGTTPFTLVIEIDAWNIRERDNWGKTEALLKKGEKLERWHWVYAGTVFRLDQRGKTQSGRCVVTERNYVTTRKGLDAFKQQLYAEALLCGMAVAETVLVVADGAVWIWNLVDDRFKEATSRVDIWHVREHLWTVARAAFGKNNPEAEAWVKPLMRHLDRRKNGASDVRESLGKLRAQQDDAAVEVNKILDREIGYFERHKERMDYKQGKALGQPIGSGAMESTCAQYQCRFKRTGQFWSVEGDERLLALETLRRNRRWHLLFPYRLAKE